MNLTNEIFKDVFEYEYGYIDEINANNALFSLNRQSPDFWDKLENIKHELQHNYIDFAFITIKFLLKDNILTDEEYVFLKKLYEVLEIEPLSIYDAHKKEIERMTYEQFYLILLDGLYDNLEEKEMNHYSEILGVGYVSICEIKRKVIEDKASRTNC